MVSTMVTNLESGIWNLESIPDLRCVTQNSKIQNSSSTQSACCTEYELLVDVDYRPFAIVTSKGPLRIFTVSRDELRTSKFVEITTEIIRYLQLHLHHILASRISGCQEFGFISGKCLEVVVSKRSDQLSVQMSIALVSWSGGKDSCLSLYRARKEGKLILFKYITTTSTINLRTASAYCHRMMIKPGENV